MPGSLTRSENLVLVNGFSTSLDRLLLQMQENLLQFPAFDHGVRRGLVKSFPYAVYFLIDDGTIVILGVLHQHRMPGGWLGRL